MIQLQQERKLETRGSFLEHFGAFSFTDELSWFCAKN